jgi:2-amino-4-hydroxy-6-hydroxymethyldihydropteridine diphosphokinase
VTPVIAYISIGSNVLPERHVRIGVEELARRYVNLCCSSVYRTVAVGFEGDDFLNLVVRLQTTASIDELVTELHAIEELHGRDRDTPSFGPRTLDLDLILYGDVVCEEPMVLPREEIMEYAFVLAPLAEIAAHETHPVNGESFARLWQKFSGNSGSITRVAGPPA